MVILLDNLKAHKTLRIKHICARYNHILLFNLAYCSRTNFIEYLFARLKQKMRIKSYKNQKDLCFKVMKVLFELKKEAFLQYFSHSLRIGREMIQAELRRKKE